MGGSSTRSYTPSKHYPRGPRHAEARYVVDRRKTPEILPPGAREARPVAENREGKVNMTGPWLGYVVGQGAYGTVYRTTANPTLLALPPKLSHGFVRAMPRRDLPVVVKVADTSGDPAEELKECAVLDDLSTAPCVRLPRVSRGLCIAPHVPKLLFCGKVHGSRKYVAVMTVAPGSTLWSEVGWSKHDVTAELYVRFERLVAALWANGVVHNDLHLKNVMYDRATGHLTILDFGFAALMPPRLTARVKAALVKGLELGVRSLGELWRSPTRSPIGTGLQSYANRTVYTKRPSPGTWYNPEGGTLLRLYSRMNAAERAKVPEVRRREWGYTGPVATSATSKARNSASPIGVAGRSAGSSSGRSSRSPGSFAARRRLTGAAAALMLSAPGSGSRGGFSSARTSAFVKPVSSSRGSSSGGSSSGWSSSGGRTSASTSLYGPSSGDDTEARRSAKRMFGLSRTPPPRHPRPLPSSSNSNRAGSSFSYLDTYG